MNTLDKLGAARIGVETLIVALERVSDIARLALDRREARAIHAEDPELFQLQLAIVKTGTAAESAKARLLSTVGMSADARLTRFPQIDRGF